MTYVHNIIVTDCSKYQYSTQSVGLSVGPH